MALIIPTVILNVLNNDAIAEGLNRAFDPKWFLDNVDPDGLHIIDQVLLHNDREWRCRALVKVTGVEEPTIGFLDVSFENWKRAEKIDAKVREELAKQGV